MTNNWIKKTTRELFNVFYFLYVVFVSSYPFFTTNYFSWYESDMRHLSGVFLRKGLTFCSVAYQVSLCDCARASNSKRHHFKNSCRYHKLWINLGLAAAEVCLCLLSHN
jgi:hypothetical protein